MDSNSNEILPPVHTEGQNIISSTETKGGVSAERGEQSSMEQPGTSGSMPAAKPVAVPSSSGVAPAVTPQTVPSSSPTSYTTNLIADDTDLIEKQWVIKAKEIIDKTKHDPRLQNNEINKVRSDYMYKRYGKEIKIPED